jgi:hypothetical protein
MREIRNAYKILVRKLKERIHFGDLGADVRLITRWILNKYDADWIRVADDNVQELTAVNIVMNLRVP